MLDAKHRNQPVVKMYVEDKQPFIETTITIRTPLRGTDLLREFKNDPYNIRKVLASVNQDVEDTMQDTFESDVLSVYSSMKNIMYK